MPWKEAVTAVSKNIFPDLETMVYSADIGNIKFLRVSEIRLELQSNNLICLQELTKLLPACPFNCFYYSTCFCFLFGSRPLHISCT